MDDLDHLLAGGQALEHLGADGALADARDEVPDDLEVDVGLEQREPDLAHGGIDVGLADAAAAGQRAKGLTQSLAEGVEHGMRDSCWRRTRESRAPDRPRVLAGRSWASVAEEGGRAPGLRIRSQPPSALPAKPRPAIGWPASGEERRDERVGIERDQVPHLLPYSDEPDGHA